MSTPREPKSARCCVCAQPFDDSSRPRFGIGVECLDRVQLAIAEAGYDPGVIAILLDSQNESARRWAKIAVQAVHHDPARVGWWVEAALIHHGEIADTAEKGEAWLKNATADFRRHSDGNANAM